MTISSGQVIAAADLNALHTNKLSDIRNFNRKADVSYDTSFLFQNLVAANTTTLQIKQSAEFTPPTDLYLKELILEVYEAASLWTYYSVTISGESLVSPITLRITGGGGATGTARYVFGNTNPFQTFLAGALYTISLNTDSFSANDARVTLQFGSGYRR